MILYKRLAISKIKLYDDGYLLLRQNALLEHFKLHDKSCVTTIGCYKNKLSQTLLHRTIQSGCEHNTLYNKILTGH